VDEADQALAKLKQIQDLWAELGRTRLDSPEYQSLMERIHALSAEYRALVDQPKKQN
jgi:hypothetical protein